MMWTSVLFISLIGIPSTKAGTRGPKYSAGPNLQPQNNSDLDFNSGATVKPTVAQSMPCGAVLNFCVKRPESWTVCYEREVAKCLPKGRAGQGFHYLRVDPSKKVEKHLPSAHSVQIPSSALQKSRTPMTQEDMVVVVLHVIDSSLFEQHRARNMIRPALVVLGGKVLAVKAGTNPLRNLSEPIVLTFKGNKQVENGTCVFWQEPEMAGRKGYWSTDGCDTDKRGDEYVCSCNHLSFFAVLVNPVLKVTKTDVVYLNYITYAGSALSIFFSFISLIIYICLQRRRQEKAIGVHMQLTGALLCLHLSFLLGSWWVQWFNDEDGWVCGALGLFLHWSLLAAISWMALEGFHLYLLLIRVFNIYVRRYLLKLSLVGWGIPTLTAAICCSLGVYGKYNLNLKDASGHNSTAPLCWMSSQFPHNLLVIYVTAVAFPCLVAMGNSCMLGLVVFKMWGLRRGGGAWKNENKERRRRLWKDCATVAGLSCVLGLPWALASTTYISLSGVYIFTILNSLQGVFVFLWSLAMTCKPRSDNASSSRDPSSQKMMTTSFNN